MTPQARRESPRRQRPAPAPKQAKPANEKGDKRAKAVCDFIEKYVVVPEGIYIGRPMVLLPEQRKFIYDVYGNVDADGSLITRRGILSVPRKNGKTGLISALLLAHVVGPEAQPNTQIFSAARSRDQASLVYNYALKSLNMSPKLGGRIKSTPSYKTLVGLHTNSVYRALSAEATTAHGLSPAVVIHDELGQVIGDNDPLYDALETAGGAQMEPLSLIISTQAPTDQDLLSLIIDDALRTQDPRIVCHLYAAAADADIYDRDLWYKVNFALGKFRALKEFEEAAERAQRMPSFESTFRNLYLNMRTARESLFLPPSVWKSCNAPINDDLFRERPVVVGLDLSGRTDLTAAVFAVQDDHGYIHLKTVAFTPFIGLEERAKKDRVPYMVWEKQGHIHTLPGRVIDYKAAATALAEVSADMNITRVAFDRWRIDLFKKEAEEVGFATEAEWTPVGQGFKDMSPRLEGFEQRALEGRLCHSGHPVLNMAASGAVAVRDPAGNRKLEKSKSTARIDALVAAVMAVGAIDAPEGSAIVSSNSLFFI